ncbi:3012_t:CDS:2, partial [Acaulospora colombiana]
ASVRPVAENEKFTGKIIEMIITENNQPANDDIGYTGDPESGKSSIIEHDTHDTQEGRTPPITPRSSSVADPRDDSPPSYSTATSPRPHLSMPLLSTDPRTPQQLHSSHHPSPVESIELGRTWTASIDPHAQPELESQIVLRPRINRGSMSVCCCLVITVLALG